MRGDLFFKSFIGLILLQGIQVFSQPTFVQRAGSSYGDYGMSCYPTHDGGTIVAQASATNGMDLHCGLIKLDATGNMQWYKLNQIGEYSYPFTVLAAKDEGYMVLAIASDSAYINNNNHILALYKTDNFGNTQWNKQYSLSNNDLPLSLVYRKAGGYISFSQGDWNIGYPYTIVTTYDDNGNLIWSKQYSAPYGLRGAKGIEMPDNNICFIGTVGDPLNYFILDLIVTMLDPSGNILWTKKFGSTYDIEPYAIAANSANEIFITGRGHWMNRGWDSFLIRLDRFGNKLSSRVYDGGTSDGEIMRCILAFDDGTCKLLGDMGTFDERDITMLNIDSNLSVSSARRYPFSPMFTNYPYDFYRSDDGGLVFTGDYHPPAAYRDAIVVKTDSDGRLPCFLVVPGITEYNEFFDDTTFAVSSNNVVHTTLNFPSNIPLNPFNDFVVCSFTADVDQITDAMPGNVYPNPFSSNVTVDFNCSRPSEYLISVFELTGRLAYSNSGESVRGDNHISLLLTGLPKGVYLLKLQTNEAVLTKRIIHQ